MRLPYNSSDADQLFAGSDLDDFGRESAPAVKRPTYEQVLKYARKAVRDEYEHPYHSNGYDSQAVDHDILNHFVGLTNSDDDFELVNDCRSQAETEFSNEHDIDL